MLDDLLAELLLLLLLLLDLEELSSPSPLTHQLKSTTELKSHTRLLNLRDGENTDTEVFKVGKQRTTHVESTVVTLSCLRASIHNLSCGRLDSIGNSDRFSAVR